MNLMSEVAGWIGVVFLGAFGAVIIYKILIGAPKGIDLQGLISEEDGKASLSRFQFLVFTFVIATGLLLIVVDSKGFPDVGSDVFGLLGISAAGYVGSKITQKAGGGGAGADSAGGAGGGAAGTR